MIETINLYKLHSYVSRNSKHSLKGNKGFWGLLASAFTVKRAPTGGAKLGSENTVRLGLVRLG